jgi:uncharacterized membrane protein
MLSVLPSQSSLFASWFSYGLGGVYWLHINYGKWFSSPRKICLAIINVLIVLVGGCMVSGLTNVIANIPLAVADRLSTTVRSRSVCLWQGNS